MKHEHVYCAEATERTVKKEREDTVYKRLHSKDGEDYCADSKSGNGGSGEMPSEFTQYVLVGFCVELDWRPLTFRKPIPEFRVCGACGLVRKKTAILSCMHVLCENCYDQSARDEARVCPIDGNRSEERDVELREVDSAELLDREVKCWNEERSSIVQSCSAER
ncbi:hypothetical protein V5799_024526 [Amblyomma americanum]|uniref:RING-type domain-containing protein n=1 Tax=Amblyomma americanum TaxID=6943 RepID=A0AAQ4EC49_AMBAM